MKLGDLVAPRADQKVRSVRNPTFSSRGLSRVWSKGAPALVIEKASVTPSKVRVLLDGETWWAFESDLEVISESG